MNRYLNGNARIIKDQAVKRGLRIRRMLRMYDDIEKFQ